MTQTIPAGRPSGHVLGVTHFIAQKKRKRGSLYFYLRIVMTPETVGRVSRLLTTPNTKRHPIIRK